MFNSKDKTSLNFRKMLPGVALREKSATINRRFWRECDKKYLILMGSWLLQTSSVLFHSRGTLVVMIKIVLIEFASLCFEKILCPEGLAAAGASTWYR